MNLEENRARESYLRLDGCGTRRAARMMPGQMRSSEDRRDCHGAAGIGGRGIAIAKQASALPRGRSPQCNRQLRVLKGARAGPLKGQTSGVKDSVCVAGIPASRRIVVLKGHSPLSRRRSLRRMLERGCVNRRYAEHDDFALSATGRPSFYCPARNPHNPEILRGRFVIRIGCGALL